MGSRQTQENNAEGECCSPCSQYLPKVFSTVLLVHMIVDELQMNTWFEGAYSRTTRHRLETNQCPRGLATAM